MSSSTTTTTSASSNGGRAGTGRDDETERRGGGGSGGPEEGSSSSASSRSSTTTTRRSRMTSTTRSDGGASVASLATTVSPGPEDWTASSSTAATGTKQAREVEASYTTGQENEDEDEDEGAVGGLGQDAMQEVDGGSPNRNDGDVEMRDGVHDDDDDDDDESDDGDGEEGRLRTRPDEMDRERRSSGSGINLSSLSIGHAGDDRPRTGRRDDDDDQGGGGASRLGREPRGADGLEGTTSKTRSASVLSSNSVGASTDTGRATEDPARGDSAVAGSDEGVDAASSSSRSGKRKAARIGSFHQADDGRDGPSSSARAVASTTTPLTRQPSASSSLPGRDAGPARGGGPATVEPNLSRSSANHVDIVSYPSPDLLKLLASLLEQIAQANDARNTRVASAAAAAAAATANANANANANAKPSTSGSATATAASSTTGSSCPSTPSTRRNSLAKNGEDEATLFGKGRFDAAPLNSPVTPHPAQMRRFPKIGGAGGPGILDNALNEAGEPGEPEHGSAREGEADEEDEMPLTPGVDLLREVGQGGGVEGFMPSLGGTHQPMPLSRRRGSSFIRNKRPDEAVLRPPPRRTSTGGAGSGSGSSTSLSSYRMTPTFSSSNESSPANSRPPSTTPQQGEGGSATPTATAAPSSNRASKPNPSSSSSSPNPLEPPLTSLFSASSVALSSPNATLCFHARNVPAISIEAYLLRILKYCPTTNEVFLALLVYFDRMARIGLEAQRLGLPKEHQPAAGGVGPEGAASGTGGEGGGQGSTEGDQAAANSVQQASKLFAIDSFNVHRLVIAGVTVASKFFSDVFYTNSRYAKVGGLPLHELNQLELQFLLLNDFRLKIPTDELQRYADQLILFWIGRNGTSNPPAAAAAQAAASACSTSGQPAVSSSPSTSAPQSPTPTHAPAPSDAHQMRPPTRLTHSAVAAHHHESSAYSSGAASPFRAGPGSAGQNSTATIDPRTPTMPSTTSYSGGGGPATTTTTTTSSSTTKAVPTPFRGPSGRPRSIRSQPSSSGTSVTSTITPGTPSTTRGGGSSSDIGGSSDDDDHGDDDDGESPGYDDTDGDAWVQARGRKRGVAQPSSRARISSSSASSSPSTSMTRNKIAAVGLEPASDGHYHDGWSSVESSSRDSSVERDERDRKDVEKRVNERKRGTAASRADEMRDD
ncbi:hypothetical protein JCM10212_001117 [Sporobolomyces blumeae]